MAKLPAPTKVLRYRTPVSRPVRSDDEYFFECNRGRVAYIDVQAFKNEITENFKETSKRLETNWKTEAVTAQVGDFRLRYFVEREREFVDNYVDRSAPSRKGSWGNVHVAWKVEPMNDNRGETIEGAFSKGSAFRQVIDWIDAKQSVVTLWVYPDSFDMFRKLARLSARARGRGGGPAHTFWGQHRGVAGRHRVTRAIVSLTPAHPGAARYRFAFSCAPLASRIARTLGTSSVGMSISVVFSALSAASISAYSSSSVWFS